MRRFVLAAAALLSALGTGAVMMPAHAQIDIQIGTAPPPVPPRNGPYGDRDRDGVPNRFDAANNRSDRDRDGIPDRYDGYDNRLARDRDHDGVPNRWDRAPSNP